MAKTALTAEDLAHRLAQAEAKIEQLTTAVRVLIRRPVQHAITSEEAAAIEEAKAALR